MEIIKKIPEQMNAYIIDENPNSSNSDAEFNSFFIPQWYNCIHSFGLSELWAEPSMAGGWEKYWKNSKNRSKFISLQKRQYFLNKYKLSEGKTFKQLLKVNNKLYVQTVC